jgi:predicted DNA-binding protein
MVVMAKKRTDGQADKHRSRNMVRLPDEFHEAMKALARENDRPLAREVLRALTTHLKAHGKEPPPMP